MPAKGNIYEALGSDTEEEEGGKAETKEAPKEKAKAAEPKPRGVPQHKVSQTAVVAEIEREREDHAHARGGAGGGARGGHVRPGRGGRVVRDGKREFERRSGTGRGREMKKQGGGAFNWGTGTEVPETVETPEVEAEAPEAAVAAPPVEAAPVVEGAKPAEEVTPPAPEPVDVSVSFDDYMAEQAKKRTGEAFAELAPTKVADLPEEAKVLDREEDEEGKKESEEEDETHRHLQRAGKAKKVPLGEVIGIRGGYRGGYRGSDRGGRGGRGRGRGERGPSREGEDRRPREPREQREPRDVREQHEPREQHEGGDKRPVGEAPFRGPFRGRGGRGGIRGRGRGFPRGAGPVRGVPMRGGKGQGLDIQDADAFPALSPQH